MTLKIIHKYSTSTGTPPAAGDIDLGEVAVNAADAKLYLKDTGGTVHEFESTTSKIPGSRVTPEFGAQACEAERYTAGFGTVADYPKAGLHINKDATNHAHYGVLDSTRYNFTGSAEPTIGNASYNDNTYSVGNQSFDHHHSYQSYPHVNMTGGTVTTLSSFWSQQDVQAGTVTNASGFRFGNPSGSGTITNLIGASVSPLTRGAVNNYCYFAGGASGGSGENWAFYSVGNTPSGFGGRIAITPNSSPTGLPPSALYIKGANSVESSMRLENTAGSNIWNIKPALEGVANVGLSFEDQNAASNKNRLYIDASGHTQPGVTGVFNLGTPSREWAAVYTNNVYTEYGYVNTNSSLLPGSVFNVLGIPGQSAVATFQTQAANGNYQFLNTSGTQVGYIQTNASSTVYSTTSDYRVKENIVSISGAIDRLKQLNVYRFNFIGEPDKTVDGFIAHEVQEIVPEAVVGTKDAVDADGKPDLQGIDQSKLVPLLAAALQDAIARIEALEQSR